MASIEELLRYLEQFMTGHLGLGQSPSGLPGGLPGGGLPGGGIPAGGMPSGGIPGGGMPAGAVPGGQPPGGAVPGGTPTAAEPFAGQLPSGVADASPEQVQEALLQFAELHPELAPFLPGEGERLELAAALGQLGAIPPAALDGFVPAVGGLEAPAFGGLLEETAGSLGSEPQLAAGELGGLLSEESGMSPGELAGLLGTSGLAVGEAFGQASDPAGAADPTTSPPFEDLLGVSDTSNFMPVLSPFDPTTDSSTATDPGFAFGAATGDPSPPVDDTGAGFGVAEPFADVPVVNEPDPAMMTPFDSAADPTAPAGPEADTAIHSDEP